MIIKPPIGIKLRKLHEEDRMKDIADAAVRYENAGLKVPEEWIREYNDLLKRKEYVNKKRISR